MDPRRTSVGFGLLLLIPARLLIFGRTMNLSELAGVFLAFVLWQIPAKRNFGPIWFIPCLFAALIVYSGLQPFRFACSPAPFYWVPLHGALESDNGPGFQVFLGKAIHLWHILMADSREWLADGLRDGCGGDDSRFRARVRRFCRVASPKSPIRCWRCCWPGYSRFSTANHTRGPSPRDSNETISSFRRRAISKAESIATQYTTIPTAISNASTP